MICPGCGFRNLMGEKFCSECGESLEHESTKVATKPKKSPLASFAPKTITCRRCGTEAKWGKKYCAECGTPIKPAHTNPNQKVDTASAVKSKKSFSNDAPSLLAPNTILQNRYQITKLIGQGGMGAIYLAADLRFSNRVAVIKEMLDHFNDPEQRQIATSNFEREAEMLASLTHPGIPQVYDRFNEGNRHYLVMEYIDGEDLEHRLLKQDKPFEEPQILDWTMQICEILNYLHGLNPPVIYRDMKPANLIVNRSNQIYIVDFGIARHFNPVKKGTMIGTQGYAPPEQYRGQVEPRSDIYALGATIHHLLSARDPQSEAPFTFPPIRQLNPKISTVTDKTISKMLDMEPENRFKSCQELLEVLNKASSKHQNHGTLPYHSTRHSGKMRDTVPISEPKGISTFLLKMGVSHKLFSTEWLLRINLMLLISVVILLVILLMELAKN